MLSTFYVGTGGYDIGGMASCFGIPGGRGFERTFHDYSCTIHCVILDECWLILDEAINEDKIEKIKEKSKERYSDAEIKKYSDNFIQKNSTTYPMN